MMKKCKYCKSEIDPAAKVCPHCAKKQGMPKWLIAIIVIVVIGVIASASGSDENSQDTKEGKVSNTKSTETKEEKFTYDVTSQYADEYGFGYYIEGSVRNNRDKDYSYVSIEFVCYDAEGNNLGTAIDNTNSLLANQTWKYKAMFMGSNSENIDHCDYHEITSW